MREKGADGESHTFRRYADAGALREEESGREEEEEGRRGVAIVCSAVPNNRSRSTCSAQGRAGQGRAGRRQARRCSTRPGSACSSWSALRIAALACRMREGAGIARTPASSLVWHRRGTESAYGYLIVQRPLQLQLPTPCSYHMLGHAASPSPRYKSGCTGTGIGTRGGRRAKSSSDLRATVPLPPVNVQPSNGILLC
ncbi:uncharacterized protein MYCFIDRAFT_195288 [Pseudocercospora fijiensis CIRAD86]|uniref:Uncharacterized protein n=1 Tax=Pseudocercospora fijiensis (strain CIRAD86) TaxID=383855 RepID=M3AHT8_PSEFD|nr:uncharacterized protein MYCFIDRAFT_195288 [Pseudocercospora fijiensis CIRAD86]EME84156.1 hypothetical protein MYCFIDRAFT_195288 [Pseudocercospora fijiensis CIRAD86]